MSGNSQELENALREFSQHWNYSVEDLKQLEAFENFVFEFGQESYPKILRVSHRSHRNLEAVQAEFHWVDYLRAQGMRIASTIASNSGEKVVVSTDREHLAVVIDKVPGVQMSAASADWTEEYFAEWGRTIGQMHRLTRDYNVGPYTRMNWYEDRYVIKFPDFVSGLDPVYLQNWKKLLSELNTLPKTANNYGLIHDDLHTKNFCLHNGRLQVFDTDDCKYHWFMGDVASALHSIALNPWSEEHSIQDFLQPFWRGYFKEYQISEDTVLELPLLIRACSAVVLGAVRFKWDLHNLNNHQQFLIDRFSWSLKNQKPIVELTEKEWLSTLPRSTL